MTNKKVLFDGQSEVLANFFAQQLPTTYRNAYSILLNLKYPIHDLQTLCTQLEKVKDEDYVKDLITNTFAPHDYGLDSVYSALEKFTANVNNTRQVGSWPGTTSTPSAWNGAPSTNTFRTALENQTTPTPWGSYSPNTWNSPVRMTQNLPNTRWEFGADVCGETACSLFCDMVNRGCDPVSAYDHCHSCEVTCRSVVPNYGTDVVAIRARAIFVQNYIIMGKDVTQCNWCVQCFLNTCSTTMTKVTGSSTMPNVATTVNKKMVTEMVN
ncbi:MAG: hypothetical protein ACI8P3_004486 [Saprospiraceae bacterium]|jgi:hypothetical protein